MRENLRFVVDVACVSLFVYSSACGYREITYFMIVMSM